MTKEDIESKTILDLYKKTLLEGLELSEVNMLYQYNCQNCGEIEVNISYKDLPLKECPQCKSTEIERIYKAVSSVWKCDGAFGKSK